MPPRRGGGESMTNSLDDDPAAATPPNSSSKKKRSSKQHRSSGSRSKHQPQDDSNDRKKERKSAKKKISNCDKEKKTSKKKSSPSSSNRIPSNYDNNSINDESIPPQPPVGAGPGVTVSQFKRQQQSMQDEASARKNAASMRQRTMMMASDPSSLARNNSESYQQSQLTLENGDAEGVHYFDDDDSDYENERAVVPRNNSGYTTAAQHPNDAFPGHRSTPIVNQPSSQVVDTIPADHPSSSIIQTHRTCSLCHRTLPRSQFSERDRFSVNLSLAPGATCRTCAMTVCAVRLKSMPGTERLLLDYAQRGMQSGMMAIGAPPPGAPIAGYLEGSDPSMAGNNNALVIRQNTDGSAHSGITGKELTLYGAPMNDPNASVTGNGANNGHVMGIPQDINSAFSGKQYGHDDSHRPNRIADCKYIDSLLTMPCYLNLNAFGLFTSSKEVSVSLAALEAVRLYGTLKGEYFRPHDCDGKAVPERKKGPRRRSKEEEQNDEEEELNQLNAKSVVCLVLGEGSTPRTAVLASQHYGWTTLSIDPQLSEEWDGYHDDIPGFTGYSGSVSDFMDNGGEYSESMIEFRRQSVQHLVIIGIQHEKDTLRLKGRGHINEIRNRYEDVPTTLVSLSPVRKATLAPQRRLGQCSTKLEKDVGYEPNCSYIDEGVFSTCRQVEVWNFHNAEDDGSGSDGNYSGEEGPGNMYHTQESTGSDYIKKSINKNNKAVKSPSFEQQIEQLNSKKKGKKAGKKNDMTSGKQQGNEKVKKNMWLEDRVAEFKKEKKSNNDNAGENQIEPYDGNASLSTLSTKGTWERMSSRDEGGVVTLRASMMDNNRSDSDYSGNDGDKKGETGPSNREEKLVVKHPNKSDDYQDEGGHGAMVATYAQENTDISEFAQDEYPEGEDNHSHTADSNDNNRDRDQGDYLDEEEEGGNSSARWSQPDENQANQVWEKALAKHDKQETFVNQFEDYYKDGNQEEGYSQDDHGPHQEDYSQGHQQDNGSYQEDYNQESYDQSGQQESYGQDDQQGTGSYQENGVPDQQDGLPPGWEAIHDPASGDYYYNNWSTGEVTWDRPAYHSTDSVGQAQHEQGGGEPMPNENNDCSNQQRDHENDGHRHDSYDNQPSAAGRESSTPPLVQYKDYDKAQNQQSFDDHASEDNDSNYVFDDQSSTSSGIAALSRWNNPSDNASKTLGNSNTDSAQEEEDLIAWSDEEEMQDHFDVNRGIQRSMSGTSQKRQPWHKRDDNSLTGNNDSFIYD